MQMRCRAKWKYKESELYKYIFCSNEDSKTGKLWPDSDRSCIEKETKRISEEFKAGTPQNLLPNWLCKRIF